VLSGFIVSSGITLEALAGGTASGTTIRKGGIEKVLAGGSAVGTSVNGGGTETVSSGGVAVGAAVGSGGKEIVLAGGTDISAAVGGGGTAIVSAGGIAIGLTVSAGGAAIISSGGVAELADGASLANTHFLSGGTFAVGSGFVATGFTASKGVTLLILSGGTTVGGTILAGGTGILESGGHVSATGSSFFVGSGGTFEYVGVNVNSAGLNVTIGSGATVEFIAGATFSGGTARGVTLEVLAGATDFGGTVFPSATLLEVFSGGLASGAVISSGGREIVFAGGTDIGATIASGGTEIVSAGGTSIATSAIGAGGMLETSSGGTAIVSGVVLNSGTLIASGLGSLVEIVSGAVVSGGAVKVGNGVVDVLSGGSASISFLSTGSGGLEIADTHGSTSAFGGVVSGFGGANHTNHAQFIDLVGVTFSAGQITSSYVSAGGSGTLTVSSGGQVVASIEFAGTYSAGNFHISSGIGGTVKITDPGVVDGGSVQFGNGQAFPQHGIDLPDIAFGAQTTLAYAENRSEIGGTLTLTDGRHATSIALLGSYMAGNFVTAADGHGGTLVTENQTEQRPLLAHPPPG
jgi:autotransporter passenger strand-loop-strand repeat protein